MVSNDGLPFEVRENPLLGLVGMRPVGPGSYQWQWMNAEAARRQADLLVMAARNVEGGGGEAAA